YWVDCDKGVRMVTDFLATTLAGRPAEFAGGRLANQPRRYGIVFPDTPEYRACGNQIVAGARSIGVDMHSATYSLNVQAITDRGRGIAQEFAQRGITTVLLATDPLFPYFMTSTAALQADWRPEWIQLGAAFLDRDFSGQLYDQAQWNRAFGISLVGQTVPARSTAAYAAYQSVDPTTSPSPYVVELAYYQLYVLAIGLHLAGPDLTPHTFASGMRSYVSPGAGQAGAWAFPEGQWTAPQDGRIVWWEATGTSPFNNQPGRYVDDGRRFPIGGLPDSGVTLFPNGIR
ncbi:MAG TPA: hypothetical protein VFK43_08760, partial [Acidimicrobiales bacterium]|nr:hypothetical protein [Acidimicrobiales bacterium]